MSNSTKQVLSVEEARRQLGISRGLMYEAIHRGDIPNIKIGRRILIPIVALERLLAKATNTDNIDRSMLIE